MKENNLMHFIDSLSIGEDGRITGQRVIEPQLYRVKAQINNGMERFNTSAYVFAVSVENAKAYFRKRYFEDDLVDIFIVERIEPEDGLVLL